MAQTQPAIPAERQGVLDADPKIISGAVRFVGTRVPVQALIDNLDGGTLVRRQALSDE